MDPDTPGPFKPSSNLSKYLILSGLSTGCDVCMRHVLRQTLSLSKKEPTLSLFLRGPKLEPALELPD